MRASLARLAGLTFALFLAASCDAIFGITDGMGTGGSGGSGVTSSGSGGTGATASSSSSSSHGSTSATGTGGAGTGGSGTGGTGTSTSATTGTGGGTGGSGLCTMATCSATGVLTPCDTTGHTTTPVTCAAASLCDPINQRCSDPGLLSVGSSRACAIQSDQSIWCWGVSYGMPTDHLSDDPASLLIGDPRFMLLTPTQIPGMKGRQVAVGDIAQCVLHDDGSVGCWGDDSSGGLGVAPLQVSRTVDPVPGLAGVVEISVGGYGSCSCARRQTGEVDCWGIGNYGCVGDAGATMGTVSPTQIPIGPAAQIAVGDAYYAPVCARLANHHVTCWNQYMAPTEVPGIVDAQDLVVANEMVVVLTASGLVWSTPLPPAPDAGTADGGPGPYTMSPALAYPGFGTVQHMAAGNAFCVAQTDSVQCAPTVGGPGTSPPGPNPVSGVPSGTIAEIRVGFGQQYGSAVQCLRLASANAADDALTNNVFCWGDDAYGALGFGGPEYLPTEVSLPSFSTHPVTSLTTGSKSVSVVLGDGSAWFWGLSGAFVDSAVPTTTPLELLDLAKNNVAIHSDDYDSEGYAIKSGAAPATLFAAMTAEPGPERLLTYSSTSFVDARRGYLDFGLLPQGAPTNGQVVVFSDNGNGNANECGFFGDGTMTMRTAPQVVPGLSATALAYQDFGDCGSHVCVILPSGALQCWGDNDSGQAGFPGDPPILPPYPAVLAPTTVVIPGVTKPIVSVAVGHEFTCATDGPTGTGQVYCWGANDRGQLGNGFAYGYASAQPMPVVGIDNGGATVAAVGVTAFDSFACAWLADKSAWCWGANDFGQLGNGTFTTETTPVQVSGITDAAAVSAGPDFACSVDTAGTVVSCWGSSYWGQSGTGKHGDDYPALTVAVSFP